MDAQLREAMGIVRTASAWSAGIGLIPLPVLDLAGVAGVQVKMIHDLCKLYRTEFSKVRAKALTGALLGGAVPYLASEGSEGLLLSFAKAVPIVGPLVSLAAMPALAAASTYAVGKVFAQHFAGGGSLFDFEPERNREEIADAFEEARSKNSGGIGATTDAGRSKRTERMMASTSGKWGGSKLCAAVLLAAMGAAQPISAGAEGTGLPLKRVGSVDLPGPPGKRFDYLTIDYDDGWLFSTHLGAKQTYVFDLASNKVLKTVPDTPGAEGIEYVPDQRKVYTSNAYDNTVGVIDLKTMTVIKKIPTEAKPDGSIYAAPFGKLYVSDERAKAVAVIDVRTDRVLTTLHFDSETGMPLYDPKAKLVYVNLQDKNELAVIDPARDAMVGGYPVQGCEGNHGMALDPEGRRAFLACQGNRKLALFDLDRRRAITALPLPAGADVVQFDPGLRRVYVACSSGAISVFQLDDPDHFRKLADVPVERRVHSLAVDRRTHRVYAPEEEELGKPVARMVVFAAIGPVE